jgi:predicted Ser/Thr protein kinase
MSRGFHHANLQYPRHFPIISARKLTWIIDFYPQYLGKHTPQKHHLPKPTNCINI